jgi:NADP-dependent 3-hydroxy acid dehydrogenase YdfG
LFEARMDIEEKVVVVTGAASGIGEVCEKI